MRYAIHCLAIALARIAQAGHPLMVHQKLDHLTLISTLTTSKSPCGTGLSREVKSFNPAPNGPIRRPYGKRRIFLAHNSFLSFLPAVSAIALQKMCIEPRWEKVTFIYVYPLPFPLLKGAQDFDSQFSPSRQLLQSLHRPWHSYRWLVQNL